MSHKIVVVAEYIWIDADNSLRGKTKVFEADEPVHKVETLPVWNYDGSSTKQACGEDSEVILKPCAIFKDPIRENGISRLNENTQNIIVLCETYQPDGAPLIDNNRYWANYIFNKALIEEPWYGLEQEYFLMNPSTKKPIGFPTDGYPNEQGQYYCSVGCNNAFGRCVAEQHMLACITAGIKISGINAEVAPGQWEFQIGPCEGIQAGDHLWVARYLLCKIAEKHNLSVDFSPKPVKGNWNGSGCHTNFSTKRMRSIANHDGDNSGLHYIYKAINHLSLKHKEHMELYGSGNEERMTGEHETASYDKFSYGVANRGASVRIGNETVANNCGYFEDRRPSSNCDPYLVTAKIFETVMELN